MQDRRDPQVREMENPLAGNLRWLSLAPADSIPPAWQSATEGVSSRERQVEKTKALSMTWWGCGGGGQ